MTALRIGQDQSSLFRPLIHGFAKNVRANIKENEGKALKIYARELPCYSNEKLDKAFNEGVLIEVEGDG